MSPRKGLDMPTILIQAAQLADEQGFEYLSLGELAKRLGIRPPSLYNHVEGLHDVKHKLAVYGLQRLHAQLLQAAAGRSGGEAVRAVSMAYIDFVRNHPGLYDATCRIQVRGDEELHQAQNRVVELVVQVLQAYRLTEDVTLHAVRALRSMLHGFASIEQTGGFGLPLDLDTSLYFMMDTFIAGMESKKV